MSEPVITAAEANRLWKRVIEKGIGTATIADALSDFLVRRVPDELPEKDFGSGWNACRDIVLRGGK